jgi:hypothetical protein
MVKTPPAAQPICTAVAASPYWRAVDSPWMRTCTTLDWRTYTTASRPRCDAVIFDVALTATHLSQQHRGRHVRDGHHGLDLVPAGAHASSPFAPSGLMIPHCPQRR